MTDSPFRRDLEKVINKHSAENPSNTPDFILAEYLEACLLAFDRTIAARDRWYDIAPKPGWDRNFKPSGGPFPLDGGKKT